MKLAAVPVAMALLISACFAPPGAVADPTPTAAASSSPSPPPTPTPTPSPVVMVGAGDIASCALDGDELTAQLLDRMPGLVFTAGDNAYEMGTAAEFANCYAPTWGRHRARTRPVPGNHDYGTAGARPYFDYFGANAGEGPTGYYSFDHGAWHVVMLNSNCGLTAGGCGPGSPQDRWLRADIAQHPRVCTVAMWHHPVFSSDEKNGNDPSMKSIWRTLYELDADLIIAGHGHQYERFAPQDAEGRADPVRGIRQIVVGTGGASLRGIGPRAPNSEVIGIGVWGVLELTLSADSYSWRFVPAQGGSFTDAGTGSCH